MNDTLVDLARDRPTPSAARRRSDPGRLPALPAALGRVRTDLTGRLWPTTLMFLLVSIVFTTTNTPGLYAGDNRLEQYLNPARRLAKSLSVWDGAAGLGGVREDFWPGTTIPVALLRGLGFGIFGAERLWHAMCLTLAGVGAVEVMRLFRRRIGIEHWVCGAIVAFGPFSAAFLIPTNLFFQYALGPWLLVAFVHGVRGARPWKWAAVFALVTLIAGNVDAPGLIANLLPIVPAALYLVGVERSTTVRRVAGWMTRALALSIACGAASLVKTYSALDSLTLRLEQSEAASTNALTSSWPETMRGLGNWLSYFAVGGVHIKPQHLAYFHNPLLVTLTFVPIIAATVMLGWSAWRPRVLFGAMAVQSMVLMVGGFPASHPSRLGRMILWSMENVRLLKGFRNTYKAGLGLTLGLGALSGMAVVSARDRMRARRGRRSRVPVLVAGLVVTGLAYPFWSGNLYHPTQTFSSVPGYWSDAFTYLDRFPFGGRSMIVPATSRSQYRWGWVGDDILDAALARDHPVSTGVPLSNPLAANLLEVLTFRMQDTVYRPGVIGPMARRLGVTEIVLRNDLDWAMLGVARPGLYQGLRNDPDLERVATFGQVGQNVASDTDRSPMASYERTLPPIEVFRVRNPSPVVRVDLDRPAVVVAGDGGAFPQMAAAGLLGADTVTRYSGSSTNAELIDELEGGGGLVISDSNRRRLRTLVGYEPDYSGTLAAGQETARPVRPLFPGVEGAESVAWFVDATSIEGLTNRLSGETTELRPSLAFDDDPSTKWELSRYEIPYGRLLRVNLRQPSVVSSASLQSVLSETGNPTVTRVVVRFAGGVEVEATADRTGRLSVDFPPVTTDFIEIEILGYDIFAPNVGLVDVAFPGLDLREFVQVPDDLLRRSEADAALRAAIGGQPMAYVFERVRQPSYRMRLGFGDAGELRPDEERRLMRRLWTPADRRFRIDGVGHLRPTVPDTVINALVRPQLSAISTAKKRDRMGAWAIHAVDGDLQTAWQAPSTGQAAVTVRMEPRKVSIVRVWSRPEFGFLPMADVEVTVGDRTVVARFKRPAGCLDSVPAPRCVPVATASFGAGISTDRLIVRVGQVPASFDLNANAVRIDEIELNGEANPLIDLDAPLDIGCNDVGLTITDRSGDNGAVPVYVAGTVGQLLAGVDIGIASCTDFVRGAGWHLLETAVPIIDRLTMTTTDPAPRPRPPEFGAVVDLTEESAGQIRVRTATATPSRVVLVNSFDARWQLSINGGPYRASTAVDAVNGWDVATVGPLDLRMRYRPDVMFGWAFVVTILAACGCMWLATRRQRPVLTRIALLDQRPTNPAVNVIEPETPPGPHAPLGWGFTVTLAMVAVVGALIAGITAVALVGMVWWSARRSDRVERLLGVASLAIITVAWLVSSLQARPELRGLSLGYTVKRTAANEFGAVGGVLLIALVATNAWTSRAPAAAPRADGAIRSLRRATLATLAVSTWRALVPAALAALVATAIGYWSDRKPIAEQYGDLIANLRRGSSYTLAKGFGPPALDAAPLAPALRAFAPALLAGGLTAIVTLLGALVVFQVTSQRAGRRAGLVALAVFAALPATWNGSVAMLVCGVAVIGGLALAEPGRLTPARAAGVGLLLAAAVLARPDAAMVVVVIAIWWWRTHADRLAVCAGVAGFVIGVAPWANFVWTNGASLRLTGSWAATLTDPFDSMAGRVEVRYLVCALGLMIAALVIRHHRLPTMVCGDLLAVGALSVGLGFVALLADVDRDPLAWATPCVAVAVAVLWASRGPSGPGPSRRERDVSVEQRLGSSP